ncbi:MAG: S8 family serine peptidase [Actinomycetota bacterium]
MRPRPMLLATAACLALIAAIPTVAVGEEGAAWIRVRFDHRITQADHTALEDAGLTNLQYSPTNAYLAFGDSDAAAVAAGLAGVADVRGLQPGEKLSAALTGRTGPVALSIAHARGGSELTRLLSGLDASFGSYSVGGSSDIVVTEALVDATLARSIAANPAVLHVGFTGLEWKLEDEGATQVLASNLNGSTPVPGYETFLSGLGIDGSGVIVGIVDDGIEANHPDLTGRVTKIVSTPITNTPPQGHGTHVAGIVGGAGATIGPLGRIEDSAGLLYGIGVAPKVSMIDMPSIQLHNTVGGPGDFPPASFELYSQPLSRAGAIGWNASWTDGGGAKAGYVARAANLDALTRDADTGTAGQQDFTFVFSAGNSGTSGITSPKEAKNIITVGSSRGHRAGNINDISSFSSRGPALDGRIEPTIAAPGEEIVSARAFTGALCGESPVPDGFGLYSYCSGTSMASPQVTGSVALIHDWWRDHNGGADPSPAMDKALLINSATDMKVRDIPNRNEGWGRVNLKALFDPSTPHIYTDQSVVLTDLDQSHDLNITTADPSKPLRVTVVWSDAPGEPGGELALVNDLDLTVTAADGTVYRGNFFIQGRSAADGEEDRLNNMENVYLDTPSGGYDVSINAFGLPGDGVPGVGDETDQDFALVISNAVLG